MASMTGRSLAWDVPPLHPVRNASAEWVVLGALVVWNVLANTVVSGVWLIPVNLLVAAAILGIALHSGRSSADLGLRRSSVRRSLRTGLVAAVAVVGAVTLVALLSAGREVLADGRFAGIDRAEMVYQTLVRIPLATALPEEIVFRGVVLGMLLGWMTPRRAVIVSSALFGLWHVLPGLSALETSTVLEDASAFSSLGGVVVQVLVTAAAGLAFAWLRLRGGHVVAAVTAHWSLNGVAYFAGWLAFQNGFG